jgi:hypothetical protein
MNSGMGVPAGVGAIIMEHAVDQGPTR